MSASNLPTDLEKAIFSKSFKQLVNAHKSLDANRESLMEYWFPQTPPNLYENIQNPLKIPYSGKISIEIEQLAARVLFSANSLKKPILTIRKIDKPPALDGTNGTHSGFSFKKASAHFYQFYEHQGLQQNLEYINHLNTSKDPLTSLIVSLLGQRYERNFSTTAFLEHISKSGINTNSPQSEIELLCLLLILPFSFLRPFDSALLTKSVWLTHCLPIQDQYEILKKLLLLGYEPKNPRTIYEALHQISREPIWIGLQFLEGQVTNSSALPHLKLIDAFDQYDTNGTVDSDTFKWIYEQIEQSSEVFELYELASKSLWSNPEHSEKILAADKFGVIHLLCTYYSFNKDITSTIQKILKKSLILGDCAIGYGLHGVISKEASLDIKYFPVPLTLASASLISGVPNPRLYSTLARSSPERSRKFLQRISTIFNSASINSLSNMAQNEDPSKTIGLYSRSILTKWNMSPDKLDENELDYLFTQLKQLLAQSVSTQNWSIRKLLARATRESQSASSRQSLLYCLLEAYFREPAILRGNYWHSFIASEIASCDPMTKSLIEIPVLATKANTIEKRQISASVFEYLSQFDVPFVSKCADLIWKNEGPKKSTEFLMHSCSRLVLEDDHLLEEEQVLDERIKICSFVASQAEAFKPQCLGEIEACAREKLVRQGLAHIHQGRIGISHERISKEFRETHILTFNRYLEYRQLRLPIELVLDAEAISAIRRSVKIGFTGKTRVTDIPFTLFSKMFDDYIELFASAKSGGLDAILSADVRHGTLEGEVVAALKKNEILVGTQFEITSDSDVLQVLVETAEKFQCKDKIRDRINRIRSETQEALKTLNSDVIQVRVKSDKPRTAFDFVYSIEERRAVYAKVQKVQSFDDFETLLQRELWFRVDRGLDDIRSLWLPRARLQIIESINSLSTELSNSGIPAENTGRIRRALSNAAIDVQAAFDTITKWFYPEAEGKILEFRLGDVIDLVGFNV